MVGAVGRVGLRSCLLTLGPNRQTFIGVAEAGETYL